MKSLLVGCIVLLCFSDTVAQERTDQSSLETLFLPTAQPSNSLHLVKGKRWPGMWGAYDYNRWRVQYGEEPIPETLFLKLVGSEEQLAAAHKRQKKFQLLQRGTRTLSLLSLVLMGGGILADDSPHKYRYAAIGASLATVSALGMIVGTNHLRKQGMSPAEVQAMIDQYNREVLKTLD